MPRLLMFAPCERLIIGQGDNSISLIGILQNVQVSGNPAKPAAEIPPNLVVPMSWVIFALWQKEAEDEGVTYQQRVVLVSPSNRIVLESMTTFVIEKDFHRIGNKVFGLPAAEAGLHTLRISLKRSDSAEWKDFGSFPLSIAHPQVSASRVH